MPAHTSASPVDPAHQALLRHTDIQFSFPSFTPPKTPEWVEAFFRFLGRHTTELRWIFWILAAAVVGWVLYSLISQYWPALTNWRPRKKPAVSEEPKIEWRPTVSEARQLLHDSDALAAQGHYTEAVHLLLLRSIEDIEKHRPRLVRPTLTSREIGLLQGLPDPARSAFVGIARVVERGLFAGHEIGADEFKWCRGEYEAFALPWQAAA